MDGGLFLPLHPGINAAVQAGLQPSLPGPLRENTQNKGKSGKGAGVSRPCTFRHCGQTPLPGRRPWRTRTRGSGSRRGGEGRGPASGQPPPLSPALQRAGSGAPEAEEERGGGQAVARPLAAGRHAAAAAPLGDSGGSAHLKQGPAELLPPLAPGWGEGSLPAGGWEPLGLCVLGPAEGGDRWLASPSAGRAVIHRLLVSLTVGAWNALNCPCGISAARSSSPVGGWAPLLPFQQVGSGLLRTG